MTTTKRCGLYGSYEAVTSTIDRMNNDGFMRIFYYVGSSAIFLISVMIYILTKKIYTTSSAYTSKFYVAQREKVSL